MKANTAFAKSCGHTSRSGAVNWSQDAAQTAEIDELLDKRFDGSLPAFVAAFTKSSHVSDKELDEVQKMIDLYRKENHHG